MIWKPLTAEMTEVLTYVYYFYCSVAHQILRTTFHLFDIFLCIQHFPRLYFKYVFQSVTAYLRKLKGYKIFEKNTKNSRKHH